MDTVFTNFALNCLYATSWQHVVLMNKPTVVLLSKLRLQLDLHFTGQKIYAWRSL